MRRLALFFFLVASVFVIAACGAGESDEDQISDAILTLATSTDPANCEALATLAFLEQVEQEEGQAAIEECEEDAKDPSDDAKTVKVTEVEVDGSQATANAAFVDGSLDGQTLTIALVEADGDWKLDELESFVRFDREKLLEGLKSGLVESSDELEGIDPECMIEGIEEFTDEELEGMVLTGPSETLVEVAEACI